MLRGILSTAVLWVTTLATSVLVIVSAWLFPRSDRVLWLCRCWSRANLAAVGARPVFRGLEHAQGASPRVFIANHQSSADIWAMMLAVPDSTRFVAKQELFRIPILGHAMAAGGFIAVDRSNRAAAIRSLKLASERIRSGTSLILYPEGTRSRDGSLLPFKKGAFHLALKAGVPVVPVAITGSFERMPPGTLRVSPGEIHVTFFPPMDVARFQPDDFRGLLDVVHDRIASVVETPEDGVRSEAR